jgi:hypothetical protein
MGLSSFRRRSVPSCLSGPRRGNGPPAPAVAHEAHGVRRSPAVLPLCLLLLAWCLAYSQGGQETTQEVADISGEYHFLSPDDTLGLLEEEGVVKGFVEVYQGEEESDTILSYPIAIGSRAKQHVEFKTAKIHEKYYRFSGSVERGKGRGPKDADYLRLVGDLEIVTVSGDDGKETVVRRPAVFKSLSAEEKAERHED